MCPGAHERRATKSENEITRPRTELRNQTISLLLLLNECYSHSLRRRASNSLRDFEASICRCIRAEKANRLSV